MANYDNDWDRNRRGFNQQWNDDDPYGNQNYSNDYNRRNERNFRDMPYGSSDYDYGRRRSNYGNMGTGDYDNSYGYNRDIYRNSNMGSRSSSDYRYGSQGSDYNYGRDDYRRGNDRDWWDKTKDEVSSWFGDDDAQRRRRMDERRGDYRGKGPKGYTRSDERIKEDVNDRLSDDSSLDASDIEVSVQNCEVTLSGTVNTRWEKRRAEDCAESVSGVKNVENRIKVKSPDSNYNAGPYNTGSATGSKASSFSSNS